MEILIIIVWWAAVVTFLLSRKFRWLITIFIALQLLIKRCSALFVNVSPKSLSWNGVYTEMLIMVNVNIHEPVKYAWWSCVRVHRGEAYIRTYALAHVRPANWQPMECDYLLCTRLQCAVAHGMWWRHNLPEIRRTAGTAGSYCLEVSARVCAGYCLWSAVDIFCCTLTFLVAYNV